MMDSLFHKLYAHGLHRAKKHLQSIL